MNKFGFLKISPGLIWGKYELSKEEFVRAVQRGETFINLELMTVFNPDTNQWEEIDGDEI